MYTITDNIRMRFASYFEDNPVEAISLFKEYLPELLPELEALKGLEQPPEYHPEGDVYTHTVNMLNEIFHSDIKGMHNHRLVWAALLHDIGKAVTKGEKDGRIIFHGHAEAGAEMAKEVLLRLHVDQSYHADIQWLISKHMHFGQFHKMRSKTKDKYFTHTQWFNLMRLHYLDVRCSNGDLTDWNNALAMYMEWLEMHENV